MMSLHSKAVLIQVKHIVFAITTENSYLVFFLFTVLLKLGKKC